tara:strand:+ start:3753 stop:3860 length:108 start_codon:yes stop_codon:yes gene_type:complete
MQSPEATNYGFIPVGSYNPVYGKAVNNDEIAINFN